MKALTLRQPWAWAICHAGKRIENRTWAPPRALIYQRFAIHAGQTVDQEAVHELRQRGYDVPAGGLVRGAIVATAVLADVIEESGDEWWEGPVGWVMGDVEVLSEPVYCRGKQGLWTPAPGALSAISARAPAPRSPRAPPPS